MPDVENAAAPSAVETTATPTFDIPRDAAGYAKWRETGEVSQPKSAEAESAGTAKEQASEPEKAKTAPDPESGTNQEHKAKGKSGADVRLQEILDDLREAGLSPAQLKALKGKAKETAAAESSPAKPEPAKQENAQPTNYQEWRKQFKPSTWVENYAKEHPEETYEDAQAAMSDYLDEVRSGYRQQEQRLAAEQKSFDEQTNKFSERYPEATAKLKETGSELVKIHAAAPTVVEKIGHSPVFHDLLYVLGGDPEKFAKFLETAKTNPVQAVSEVAVIEYLIMQDLNKQNGAGAKDVPDRGEDGKFKAAKVPEKKVSDAPPPATEVNTRGSAPADEADSAFEKGDFRKWKAIEDRRDIARRKGQ